MGDFREEAGLGSKSTVADIGHGDMRGMSGDCD